jgi:hypothetical protein
MTPEHFCHCGKIASFGYRVWLLNDMPGEWYCREHHPKAPPPVITVEERKMKTPTRFLAKCDFCDSELDTRELGVCQWTSGWVRNREGGGGHGISLPLRADRWAHTYCVESAGRGQVGQYGLFDLTRGT